MRYIRLQSVSSEAEVANLAAGARTRESREQVAELLKLLSGAEGNCEAELKRFDGVVVNGRVQRISAPLVDYAEKIFVYCCGGKGPLWAAVECDNDRKVTLLKVYTSFSGTTHEETELLADTFDRKKRGERYDGQGSRPNN